jgi:hypothetical protein
MQKSFVVKKAIHISGGYAANGKNIEGFLTRCGDVVVFDVQNDNNLTIYRNEAIAKVLPHQSNISIEGLIKGGFFEEIKKTAPAAPPPVVEPVIIAPPPPIAVVEEIVPKPQEKSKPKKLVKTEAAGTGSTKEDSTKFDDSSV